MKFRCLQSLAIGQPQWIPFQCKQLMLQTTKVPYSPGAQPSTGIFHWTLMWEFTFVLKTHTKEIKEIQLFWQWHRGFFYSLPGTAWKQRLCLNTFRSLCVVRVLSARLLKSPRTQDELMSVRQRLTVSAGLLLHLLKYLNQAMPMFIRW